MAETPTAETSKLLKDELLFQRATPTYLPALPLLNTLGMKLGSEKAFGTGYNVLPIWKKWLDAKTLVTPPNSDVIYAMSYLDLGKDGSIVFEAPPGLQGILLDFWQRPIPGDDLGVELRTFHGEPHHPLDQHIFRSGFGRGPPAPDVDRKPAGVRTNLRPRSKRGAQALMRAPKAVDY